MQESAYNIKALNNQCGFEANLKGKVACVVQDVGIAQINHTNVLKYGLELERLRNDLEYSLDAGAKILSWFNKRYSKKEPKTWYCRYNTGTAKYAKIRHNCEKYMKLVQRFM